MNSTMMMVASCHRVVTPKIFGAKDALMLMALIGGKVILSEQNWSEIFKNISPVDQGLEL